MISLLANKFDAMYDSTEKQRLKDFPLGCGYTEYEYHQ
jgi:hypothetical protein